VNALRAHDFVIPKAPEPDLRGLRRILAIFIIGVVASAVVCAILLVREARRGHTQSVQIPCTCMGRCLRH